MGKGARVFVFFSTMLVLTIVYFLFKVQIAELGDKGVLILTTLITLSFALLFTEHFFTRPTDVVASSVSFLVLLTPSHDQLRGLGAWYWIFWSYNALLLVVALASLLLVDARKPTDGWQNKTAAVLKSISTRLGNARVLWFSFFALCLFFYVDSQAPVFIVLFAYAAAVLLIDPRRAVRDVRNSLRESSEVARIFGVHSENSFLAKCAIGVDVRRFESVRFRPNGAGAKIQAGVVVSSYALNDECWIKIVTDPSLGWTAQPFVDTRRP